MGIVRGAIFLSGNFPGAIVLGGNCPGGDCPVPTCYMLLRIAAKLRHVMLDHEEHDNDKLIINAIH